MSISQSSPAIMLRIRPYGEVDKIATFLTRDFGKLTGIAKGAKNSRRRFPNCLEPFARVRVHFRSRLGAGMVFLERCELSHPGSGMASPNRFAYGSYLLELVDTLTHEADAIPEVYDLLEAGLTRIEAGPATATLLRGFELQLLRDLGYAPQLETCGRCQRAFEDGAYAAYDDRHGTLVCERCADASRATERYGTATLTALARLQDLPLAPTDDTSLNAHMAREAAALTGRLLAAHLPRPLRSLELIATLARQGTG